MNLIEKFICLSYIFLITFEHIKSDENIDSAKFVFSNKPWLIKAHAHEELNEETNKSKVSLLKQIFSKDYKSDGSAKMEDNQLFIDNSALDHSALETYSTNFQNHEISFKEKLQRAVLSLLKAIQDEQKNSKHKFDAFVRFQNQFKRGHIWK
jgi:hypothetical protein